MVAPLTAPFGETLDHRRARRRAQREIATVLRNRGFMPDHEASVTGDHVWTLPDGTRARFAIHETFWLTEIRHPDRRVIALRDPDGRRFESLLD